MLSGFLRESALRRLGITVKFIDGATALSWLNWELTGQLDPVSGTTVPARTGILLFVLRDGTDGWKVLAAQNTDVWPVRQIIAPDGMRKK